MPFSRLQGIVGARAAQGDRIEDINREVIAPSDLSEEHKSALWLYGWTARASAQQRYQIRQARRRMGRPSALGE
jgi:hypothetical protein